MRSHSVEMALSAPYLPRSFIGLTSPGPDWRRIDSLFRWSLPETPLDRPPLSETFKGSRLDLADEEAQEAEARIDAVWSAVLPQG